MRFTSFAIALCVALPMSGGAWAQGAGGAGSGGPTAGGGTERATSGSSAGGSMQKGGAGAESTGSMQKGRMEPGGGMPKESPGAGPSAGGTTAPGSK